MTSRLGKGLEALIPIGNEATERNENTLTVAVDLIKPNKNQPRKVFDEEKLHELAASIRENGIIQPIVVSKNGNLFEIIAGERRLEASKLAGLKEVPVIIRKISEKESLQFAIIENIQREDLNDIEEALAYQQLSTQFNMTHVEIAHMMGKDRVTITNTMRLLKLEEDIQKMILDGAITAGHARAILQVEPLLQFKFAQYIAEKKLSVRKAEQESKKFGQDSKIRKKNEQDDYLIDTEKKLTQFFGAKIEIQGKKNKGKIVFSYKNERELNKLLELMLNE